MRLLWAHICLCRKLIFYPLGAQFRLSTAIPRAIAFPALVPGFPLQSGAQFRFLKKFILIINRLAAIHYSSHRLDILRLYLLSCPYQYKGHFRNIFVKGRIYINAISVLKNDNFTET